VFLYDVITLNVVRDESCWRWSVSGSAGRLEGLSGCLRKHALVMSVTKHFKLVGPFRVASDTTSNMRRSVGHRFELCYELHRQDPVQAVVIYCGNRIPFDLLTRWLVWPDGSPNCCYQHRQACTPANLQLRVLVIPSFTINELSAASHVGQRASGLQNSATELSTTGQSPDTSP
jgi:hypothetical protein